MTEKRALVIGSPKGGLEGVETDVENITKRLVDRGFSCTPCVGRDATRAGVLDALASLERVAQPGDAVTIYYSGHGGRCHLVADTGAEPEPPFNYLVPMDHDSAMQFRGITGFELALYFFDLSNKIRDPAKETCNITVLLDCCHASTMVRGDKLFRSERDSRPAPGERSRHWEGQRAYLMPDELRDRYEEFLRRRSELHDDSNPHVLRVVATGAGSPAFESRNQKGSAGYLTTELCKALDESLHAPVSWDTIVRRVRERIVLRRRSTTQRPELEGPRGRLPFSLETAADIVDHTTLTYRQYDATAWVRAGKLHGLHRADELDVLGAAPAVVAKAEIEDLYEDHARVELRTKTASAEQVLDRDRFPAGSGVAIARYERRHIVWVDPSLTVGEALRGEIDGQARLSRVEDANLAMFKVVGNAGELRVEGPQWLHRVPRPTTPAGVAALVHDLDDLARRLILEQQLAEAPGLVEGLSWTVEVFVELPDGKRKLLKPDHGPLPVGTRLYTELKHLSKGAPTLYVNVLDRGISGRMSLLNTAQPAGVQLQAPQGPRPTLLHVPGLNRGMRLIWPKDVPRQPGLTEELVLVASLRPLDLRNLLMVDAGLRRTGRKGVMRDPAKEIESTAEPIWDIDPDASLGTRLLWEVRRVGFGVIP